MAFLYCVLGNRSSCCRVREAQDRRSDWCTSAPDSRFLPFRICVGCFMPRSKISLRNTVTLLFVGRLYRSAGLLGKWLKLQRAFSEVSLSSNRNIYSSFQRIVVVLTCQVGWMVHGHDARKRRSFPLIDNLDASQKIPLQSDLLPSEDGRMIQLLRP